MTELSADEQAVADMAYRWLERYADISPEPDPRWLLSDEGLRRMLRDCVAALDLPARDAAVRAKVAEDIATAFEAIPYGEWLAESAAELARGHATTPGQGRTEEQTRCGYCRDGDHAHCTGGLECDCARAEIREHGATEVGR